MSKYHVSRVRELYKLILRLHRSLPDDLKILGDNYAREEFKRHKKCKPQEAQIFLNEWREYAMSMSRQAAPSARAQRRSAAEQQAGPSREVRAADSGQAAAGGGEGTAAEQGKAVARGGAGKAADQGQTAAGGGEAAAAANALIFQAAAANAHRHFGNNLDQQRIQQFTPDQLLSLYYLLMTAQGENPQNTEELLRAIESSEIAKAETIMEKISVEIPEMEVEEATKPIAIAKNAKKAESTQEVTDSKNNPNLHEAVTKAKENALKKAKKVTEILEKTQKLVTISKTKAEEKQR